MARRRSRMSKTKTQRISAGSAARRAGFGRSVARGPRKLTVMPGTAPYRHFPVPKI